ncbi:sugar ABC transporter substrate-binding protein [Sphaerisporangium siamense]|uniref:Multiple sugar transport system substrate-binding protein n=1 Tax=Sphaerisporangium siamense TaxID=795645 RepID=A0A7W7GE10_9ACTN|nr:extracellular solute-binding protein [Sphaerisporangium siamense]MBB4703571.1 multiple sugar transport system substrate-binding protein [Sphaerisporangium siamense]GII82042.1 sugar ABC transporter substrate-binding protein [Sphaerisporangium siamense]
MTSARTLPLPAAVTVSLTVLLAACGSGASPVTDGTTLTVTANAISGGKNSATADWTAKWLIPRFEQAQKAAGRDVRVVFQPNGVDDEEYKTKIALDLRSGTGADVIDLDGIWVGEFAQAGYIEPLSGTAGPAVDRWEGWTRIPRAVRGLGVFEGRTYGLPQGTDGRVLFYNKTLFARAGLPAAWQPRSWQDLLDAGAALKKAGVPTPLQINAGTAMGEATSMQGALPLLAGAGAEIYANGKWTGASQALKDVLDLYRRIYTTGLGDPRLQQEAKGRDKSFQEFADGRIGVLAEGDYFWRSVIEPTAGVAPMKDRDRAVGYALIPAERPGAGVRGQDFVSMSGGAVRVLNPRSENAALAWELLAFMHSAEATKAGLAGEARITSRTDVNDEVLKDDPMLSFVSDRVLPLTAYRPGLAVYPQISTALQQATAAVTTGTPVDEAATAYDRQLQSLVGPSAISR